MELRVLKYFLAIAQEGNITSASNKLHVGQPTLSRQIKDLERELGQPLIERHSHGVRLTPEGQLLRQYAEQMVELSDRVETDFKGMKGKPAGDVYVGGAETDSLREITRAAAAVQQEHPGLQFHYIAGNAGEVTSKLDRGLLDFAVLSQPANLSKYKAIDLPRSDSWVVYLRRDNPLAAKERIALEDLVDEPLIMSEQVMNPRSAGNNVAAWFGDAFEELNVVATFNLPYAGSIMVQEGMGTMFTFDKLVIPCEENNLVTRPIHPPLSAWLALVWRRDVKLSPAASLFLKGLLHTLGNEPLSGVPLQPVKSNSPS